MNSTVVDAAMIRRLVEAALLAPSGDNCQPWRFGWDGRQLEIRFLADRAASLYDANCAASWVALGASLENLRITARAIGATLSEDIFPTGGRDRVAARIGVAAGERRPEPLFDAIAKRCVNRRPYSREPIPREVSTELVDVARSAAGVQLQLVEDPAARARVAALASRNDRLLFEHPELHHGLYRWLRWSDRDTDRTGDGMPIGSLELHPAEQLGFRLLGSWPIARGCAGLRLTRMLPRRSVRVYRHSAAIGLLSVADNSPQQLVAAGSALQRVWLTATERGLAFQPITGMICLLWRCRFASGDGLSAAQRAWIEQTGEELAQWLPAVRDRMPVMLFRLGYAPAPTARARRLPIESVLDVASN